MNLRRIRVGLALVLAIGIAASANSDSSDEETVNARESTALPKVDETTAVEILPTSEFDVSTFLNTDLLGNSSDVKDDTETQKEVVHSSDAAVPASSEEEKQTEATGRDVTSEAEPSAIETDVLTSSPATKSTPHESTNEPTEAETKAETETVAETEVDSHTEPDSTNYDSSLPSETAPLEPSEGNISTTHVLPSAEPSSPEDNDNSTPEENEPTTFGKPTLEETASDDLSTTPTPITTPTHQTLPTASLPISTDLLTVPEEETNTGLSDSYVEPQSTDHLPSLTLEDTLTPDVTSFKEATSVAEGVFPTSEELDKSEAIVSPTWEHESSFPSITTAPEPALSDDSLVESSLLEQESTGEATLTDTNQSTYSIPITQEFTLSDDSVVESLPLEPESTGEATSLTIPITTDSTLTDTNQSTYSTPLPLPTNHPDTTLSPTILTTILDTSFTEESIDLPTDDRTNSDNTDGDSVPITADASTILEEASGSLGSDISLSEPSGVDVSLPWLSIPEVSIPELSIPEVTFIWESDETPTDLSTPEEAPTTDIIKESTADDFTAAPSEDVTGTKETTVRPSITLPEVSWPEVEWSTFSWPEVTWPEVSWPEVTWPEVTWPEVSWPEISWPEVTWPGDETQTGDDFETDTFNPTSSALSIIEVPTWLQTESFGEDTAISQFIPPWLQTSEEDSAFISLTFASADTLNSFEDFTTGDTFVISTPFTDGFEETSFDGTEPTGSFDGFSNSFWIRPTDEISDTTYEDVSDITNAPSTIPESEYPGSTDDNRFSTDEGSFEVSSPNSEYSSPSDEGSFEVSSPVGRSTDVESSQFFSTDEENENISSRPTHTYSSQESEVSTPERESTPATTHVEQTPATTHVEEPPTTMASSTTSSTTKSLISVPTSVDFSRLTAEPTELASATDTADTGSSLPQVIFNPLSSTCSQCLTFTLRILAPYENLFGSNNYLASQAFNQVPNLVALALGINENRATASMIFAQEDTVVTANRRRSMLIRKSEPDYPHYYISLSITKDSSVVNPKSELQLLSTTLSSQVRDSSSDLHTLNSWGPLIDRTYMKVTSNIDDLNGVAQVAPDSPGQVDSPLQGDAKSTSRSKWIGVGVGVGCAVVIAACVLLVHYRRRNHILSKRQIRQNFVAIQ
ncbi:hypothetical protein GGI11_004457 [Coemansia sp. RSA 2049]|nr:hypothetical protein GGI11_004457 [Coemansia sp. RSA 2049]